MAQDIFVVKTMGDALRNTGYKNIECAMSEIIDNSVQAEAKNVFVIVSLLADNHAIVPPIEIHATRATTTPATNLDFLC